jgi:adenine-specific DNA-methyltransferase
MKKMHSLLRATQFAQMSDPFNKTACFVDANAFVVQGDSLESLKQLPDGMVSLILTDPPYHSTKKENITNDTAFESDEAFLAWIEQFSREWKRILRPNGSVFMFCSSSMAARLELLLSQNFNILSHLVWTKPNDPGFDGWKGKMRKESLRQWYAHSERILFLESATEGNLKRSNFGHFLKLKRQEAGLSMHELTAMVGAHGKVNHGGAVSNWEAGRNIPSPEQYEKIREGILSTGKVLEMPIYEDVIRPFEVNASVEFTDVWNFNSVRPYKGKHPAEKPLDMLEHCVRSTTFEHDIVLDCFAGSGSTAIAALNCHRKTISFEIESEWVQSIKNRLENHDRESLSVLKNRQDLMRLNSRPKQPTLFFG